MSIAIILSGGIGKRMKSSLPKQYLIVQGKPIIAYTLDKFQNNSNVSAICIVVAQPWQDYVSEVVKEHDISKFALFATPGDTRQKSIINALTAIKSALNPPDSEIIIIHDAVRPLVSDMQINDCVEQCSDVDGVMPAFNVKDTTYYCENGLISQLLDRSCLYSGQSPESFVFKKYYDACMSASPDLIESINGTSEMAFLKGLTVKVIDGDENNFKITTPSDLIRFKEMVSK